MVSEIRGPPCVRTGKIPIVSQHRRSGDLSVSRKKRTPPKNRSWSLYPVNEICAAGLIVKLLRNGNANNMFNYIKSHLYNHRARLFVGFTVRKSDLDIEFHREESYPLHYSCFSSVTSSQSFPSASKQHYVQMHW